MIDIKCGMLFPFPFLLLGGVIAVAGLVLIVENPLASFALIIVALTVLTAHEGTEIDPVKRTYREYNAFLFFKSGKWKGYDNIEKIFLNSANVSQRIYTAHTLHSSSFVHRQYNVFLKFSDGTKVFLAKDRNKERALKRFGKIARKLDTILSDATTSHPSG